MPEDYEPDFAIAYKFLIVKDNGDVKVQPIIRRDRMSPDSVSSFGWFQYSTATACRLWLLCQAFPRFFYQSSQSPFAPFELVSDIFDAEPLWTSNV